MIEKTISPIPGEGTKNKDDRRRKMAKEAGLSRHNDGGGRTMKNFICKEDDFEMGAEFNIGSQCRSRSRRVLQV